MFIRKMAFGICLKVVGASTLRGRKLAWCRSHALLMQLCSTLTSVSVWTGRPQRKFVLQDGRTADSIRRLLEWAREGALASTEQQLSASASPTATFVDTSGSNPCASSSKLLPGAAASTSSWQADAVATVSAAAAGTKPGGLEVSIDEPGPSSSMFQQQLPGVLLLASQHLHYVRRWLCQQQV